MQTKEKRLTSTYQDAGNASVELSIAFGIALLPEEALDKDVMQEKAENLDYI